MRSVTFSVSKGGVGKSLMTANVGVALAQKGKNVVLVEGDPNQPLQKILESNFSSDDLKLEDVVRRDLVVEKAVYSTGFANLFLVPSGISLQSYFDTEPIVLARKLDSLQMDFMLIDVPFPLGKAAFLSLGICEYFIPILTEDEFVLCVESAIDTIRLGTYFFRSVPLGFVFNRIKTPEKFTEGFVEDLEDLLEIPCITQVKEDLRVSKSYGGVNTEKAFVAYAEIHGSEFAKSIDKIAALLLGHIPQPEKKDVLKLLQEIIYEPSKI